MRRLILILALMLVPVVAMPVEPQEVLQDPVLEKRARSISKGLRCLQCRNESIDQSNAEIARDLRLLVRERLLAGDTDTEVVDYIVARYGEYVLLQPNGRGANLVLWLAGPTLLLITLAGLFLVRVRSSGAEGDQVTPLNEEEEAALRELLDDR